MLAVAELAHQAGVRHLVIGDLEGQDRRDRAGTVAQFAQAIGAVRHANYRRKTSAESPREEVALGAGAMS